jgi:ABC-type transport system involved in cytochrome c biogenesis permease subunit
MLTVLRRDLDRFNALSGGHKRAFIEACLYMPFFSLGVQVLGLARMQSLFVRPVTTVVPVGLAEIEAMGTLVNTAARRGPAPASCLTRSLLLAWFLRRRGVAAELRVGVRLLAGVLHAHAWVECDGRPVNDKPDIADDFAPFERLLAASDFDRR